MFGTPPPNVPHSNYVLNGFTNANAEDRAGVRQIKHQKKKIKLALTLLQPAFP